MALELQVVTPLETILSPRSWSQHKVGAPANGLFEWTRFWKWRCCSMALALEYSSQYVKVRSRKAADRQSYRWVCFLLAPDKTPDTALPCQPRYPARRRPRTPCRCPRRSVARGLRAQSRLPGTKMKRQQSATSTTRTQKRHISARRLRSFLSIQR